MTMAMSEGRASARKINRIRTILHVAWLAVLLGVGIELAVVIARVAVGTSIPRAAFLAEIAQQVSWAFIVCIGVAIGTMAASARTLVSGLLGLISGPLGWGFAKAVQRVVQTTLGTAPDQIGSFFYLLCAVKGLEYLILGAALGHLSEKGIHNWKAYAGIGACLGLATSALVIALNQWHGTPMNPAKLAGIGVGEFLFPVGCALVVFAPLQIRRYMAD
jgi:hypothetical protein